MCVFCGCGLGVGGGGGGFFLGGRFSLDISGIRPWVAGLPKAALMEAMKGAWGSPVNKNSSCSLKASSRDNSS